MRERAVENELHTLKFVPDYFKAQGMCERAVKDDPSSLHYVPNWFVTWKEVYIGV